MTASRCPCGAWNALTAVPVSPGVQRIELRYSPPLGAVSTAVGGFGLGVLLMLLWATWRQREQAA